MTNQDTKYIIKKLLDKGILVSPELLNLMKSDQLANGLKSFFSERKNRQRAIDKNKCRY